MPCTHKPPTFDALDQHVVMSRVSAGALMGFFSGMEDAFKPVQFRDPAPAMLSLLLKTGFEVSKGD